MSAVSVSGSPLPNLPWEDRPAGSTAPVWRYSANPIIPHDLLPTSNSIFNSAVVPFEQGFAGVFRCDDTTRRMQLHAGRSADAVHWTLEADPIEFVPASGAVTEISAFEHAYDPRVVYLENHYYVTWCNGYHGPTIGLGYTDDFTTFYQLENAFLPFNRNGVLFPRRIGGKIAMLSRPSDNGHTPFGDIFYSESPDFEHWGRHRWVMGRVGGWASGWQSTKIGAGPIPIETSEGWLLIYHGVLTSCNGFVYSFGAALLDLEQPWKVMQRSSRYLIAPQAPYERTGDVPNVAFPCAALVDAPSGRVAIYYGAADTSTALAFGYVDDIVEFVKANPLA